MAEAGRYRAQLPYSGEVQYKDLRREFEDIERVINRLSTSAESVRSSSSGVIIQPAGGGNISGNLTAGTVPVAQDYKTLIDSSIRDDGSLVTVNNDLMVNGAMTVRDLFIAMSGLTTSTISASGLISALGGLESTTGDFSGELTVPTIKAPTSVGGILKDNTGASILSWGASSGNKVVINGTSFTAGLATLGSGFVMSGTTINSVLESDDTYNTLDSQLITAGYADEYFAKIEGVTGDFEVGGLLTASGGVNVTGGDVTISGSGLVNNYNQINQYAQIVSNSNIAAESFRTDSDISSTTNEIANIGDPTNRFATGYLKSIDTSSDSVIGGLLTASGGITVNGDVSFTAVGSGVESTTGQIKGSWSTGLYGGFHLFQISSGCDFRAYADLIHYDSKTTWKDGSTDKITIDPEASTLAVFDGDLGLGGSIQTTSTGGGVLKNVSGNAVLTWGAASTNGVSIAGDAVIGNDLAIKNSSIWNDSVALKQGSSGSGLQRLRMYSMLGDNTGFEFFEADSVTRQAYLVMDTGFLVIENTVANKDIIIKANGTGEIAAASLISASEGVETPITEWYYWGGEATNDSWRQGVVSGNFVIQRRISGTWTTKHTVLA